MNFTVMGGDPARARCEVLAIPLFDSDLGDKRKQPPGLVSADKKLRGLLLKSAVQEGFKGKGDQTFSMHTQGKLPASRVVLLGLGPKAKWNPESLRLAAGRAIKLANKLQAKSIAIALPATEKLAEAARAAVEGIVLGAYRFDRYRSSRNEKDGRRTDKVFLVLPDGAKKDRAIDEAIALGRRIGEATNWAKDLVNEPAAVVTPSKLAEEAAAMAKERGLTIQIKERKDIQNLKMGMFLGVAQGSNEPPKLIHLIYTPKDPEAAKRKPVALVGKAITFDSGGLSLKTAEGMVDMKTDMAGSAAVLGAMRVVSMLKPPFPVHAFMGACENMPSGTAYRPGDVLISRIGKTVEITNTDAEGRLVLGDILAFANEQKPAAIIDLATLTGACMVALGHYIAGAFSPDDELASELLDSAKAAGEELWRMPMFELQKDALRSDIADMKNSGERWGGAINAAMFLKEFVGETPWVHVDIAGPSQSPKERGYYAKGATGVGVRTLAEFIRRRAESIASESAPPAPEKKTKKAAS
jgi:leucyl aminopeptidase